MRDKTELDFWREVRLGQAVELRDLLTLENALERKKPSGSLFYTIEKISTIKEFSGIAEWQLFFLKDFDNIRDLLLMVKIVDNEFDVRVYYQAPDEHLISGSREDLTDSWIWNNDRFVNTFERTYEDSVDIFVKKGKKDFQGTCVTDPQPSGIDRELLATIVEYSANTTKDDKE